MIVTPCVLSYPSLFSFLLFSSLFFSFLLCFYHFHFLYSPIYFSSLFLFLHPFFTLFPSPLINVYFFPYFFVFLFSAIFHSCYWHFSRFFFPPLLASRSSFYFHLSIFYDVNKYFSRLSSNSAKPHLSHLTLSLHSYPPWIRSFLHFFLFLYHLFPLISPHFYLTFPLLLPSLSSSPPHHFSPGDVAHLSLISLQEPASATSSGPTWRPQGPQSLIH